MGGPQAAASSSSDTLANDVEVGPSATPSIFILNFLSQMDVEDADSEEELGRASQARKTLELEPQPVIGGNVGEWFVERSKYIPIRLTLMERKYLRLLEAALGVSEYVCAVVQGWGITDPLWDYVLADGQGRHHRIRFIEAEAYRSTNPGALRDFIWSPSLHRL